MYSRSPADITSTATGSSQGVVPGIDPGSGLLTLFASLILALLLYPTTAAYAGDEDMNPSIYQRFDPETGYMIPVDPPPQHNAPAKADARPAQKAASQPAPATAGPAAEPARSPAFWVAGAAGLLIIGGFLWRRKRAKS